MSKSKAGNKTVNTDSKFLVLGGTDEVNELFGTEKRDYIRGYGGNDTLTGGSTSNDVFIFESTLTANGVDTITDFNVYEPTIVEGITVSALEDELDLSLVFDKNIKINSKNVNSYIKVENNELLINLDGQNDDWEVWARFDNNGQDEGGGYINDGDLINVRTQNFDGKIVATNDGGDGGDGDGGDGDDGEYSLTNAWFENLYEENITFPTEAVLWEYWGLTLDDVKTEYNWDGSGGIGSDSTDPYFIMDATFIYQGTGLPAFTTSDISSVTLYENSTDASYDIDLFGLAEVNRVEDVFVSYSLLALEGAGPISFSDIGVGDYLTVNLTGGTSFQIQHYDFVFV